MSVESSVAALVHGLTMAPRTSDRARWAIPAANPVTHAVRLVVMPPPRRAQPERENVRLRRAHSTSLAPSWPSPTTLVGRRAGDERTPRSTCSDHLPRGAPCASTGAPRCSAGGTLRAIPSPRRGWRRDDGRALGVGPIGGAADHRRGAGGRGGRCAGARVLRPRSHASAWLSQRLPDGAAEDGRSSGGVQLAQIADHAEPFRPRIREILRSRTKELEALAVEMRTRTQSVRDIKAAFADDAGKTLLSRAAVSELTERLWAEYEAFASHDLSEFEVTYLYVDGIAERLNFGQPRDAALAAWGILADDKKAMLHFASGRKEDTPSCREFFQEMRRRGLFDPFLVVSDGAPGVIRAIEECFPRAARQRCPVHKMRNLQSKVQEHLWPEFKACTRACYQAASSALARLLRAEIIAAHGAKLPSAVVCLENDFEARIAHIRFPIAHRRAIRTTNLLERLWGEEPRRTNVTPHAFGKRAALGLIYSTLIRAGRGPKGQRIPAPSIRQGPDLTILCDTTMESWKTSLTDLVVTKTR